MGWGCGAAIRRFRVGYLGEGRVDVSKTDRICSEASDARAYDSADLDRFDKILVDACGELVKRDMRLEDPRAFATMRQRMASAIFIAANEGSDDVERLTGAALEAAFSFVRAGLRRTP
jgi:hypothetical protein